MGTGFHMFLAVRFNSLPGWGQTKQRMRPPWRLRQLGEAGVFRVCFTVGLIEGSGF